MDFIKAEGGGVQHADVAGVQTARQACKGSGKGKSAITL